MTLRDDPTAQWPDAVLPGSPAARQLDAERRERDAADKARRADLDWPA